MEAENQEEPGNKKSENKIIKKISKNYWIAISAVLAVLLVVSLLAGGITGSTITGSVIKDTEAGEKIMEFAQAQGIPAELIDVNDIGGLYEVTLSIQGQPTSVYLTKDGKNLVQGVVSLDVIQTPQTQEPNPEPTVYSEEDLQKLKEFNECLASKGLMIYGSNTCPHCRNLVALLGGYEVASSVYVECSEERQRCDEETKTGYVPEIQLNGESYEGARTLQGFAEAIGCPAPHLQAPSTDESGAADTGAQC